MNIEHFEYDELYSIPLNMSNDAVIQFVVHFHRVYPWLLFPFGFIGSLLTIVIFRRKKFQKFGCSILFVAESSMVGKQRAFPSHALFSSLGLGLDHSELYASDDTLHVSVALTPAIDLHVSDVQISHELLFPLRRVDSLCHIPRTSHRDQAACLDAERLQPSALVRNADCHLQHPVRSELALSDLLRFEARAPASLAA